MLIKETGAWLPGTGISSIVCKRTGKKLQSIPVGPACPANETGGVKMTIKTRKPRACRTRRLEVRRRRYINIQRLCPRRRYQCLRMAHFNAAPGHQYLQRRIQRRWRMQADTGVTVDERRDRACAVAAVT